MRRSAKLSYVDEALRRQRGFAVTLRVQSFG